MRIMRLANAFAAQIWQRSHNHYTDSAISPQTSTRGAVHRIAARQQVVLFGICSALRTWLTLESTGTAAGQQ
jgi:hypothetical protein